MTLTDTTERRPTEPSLIQTDPQLAEAPIGIVNGHENVGRIDTSLSTVWRIGRVHRITLSCQRGSLVQ